MRFAGREAGLSATILDGRALAERIKLETAGEVAEFVAARGRAPGLTVVLVGDDPASKVYVRNKEAACKACGIRGRVLRLPSTCAQAELIAVLDELNSDASVDGILVQLPLPPAIDERAVIDRINPLKDVDGFHIDNVGRLAIGLPRFAPCTPLGIVAMLRDAGVTTRGARAVVLGRSMTVGKPLALLLLQKGEDGDATVTVAHSASREVASIAREADILIAAIGRPELVRDDWVKPGAVVVDVGIHRRDDGTLCGDVHFPTVAEVASRISPVPGGVGPLTVAMLLKNTLRAARLAHGG